MSLNVFPEAGLLQQTKNAQEQAAQNTTTTTDASTTALTHEYSSYVSPSSNEQVEAMDPTLQRSIVYAFPLNTFEAEQYGMWNNESVFQSRQQEEEEEEEKEKPANRAIGGIGQMMSEHYGTLLPQNSYFHQGSSLDNTLSEILGNRSLAENAFLGAKNAKELITAGVSGGGALPFEGMLDGLEGMMDGANSFADVIQHVSSFGDVVTAAKSELTSQKNMVERNIKGVSELSAVGVELFREGINQVPVLSELVNDLETKTRIPSTLADLTSGILQSEVDLSQGNVLQAMKDYVHYDRWG